jgi:murein DD-endopeptidase MepM/ murein hydrolase activator NlpD
MVADDSGVVVKVRHHPQDGGRFAGDQITIQGAHGNSYFYAHGVASVKPGQKVRAGQVIGRSGSANGVAHLHFGVEKGDPRKLLGSK